MAYSSDSPPSDSKAEQSKSKAEQSKSKAEKPKPVTSSKGGKLSEKQKADLKKHMEGHKKKGMSASEMKSHRMKMMVRMRKGDSVAKAHKDLMRAS